MRPLAIAVVIVGVVLLALGTWLILRASFGVPRKPRPARPAPRPAPPVADRPRTPVAFPPAAVARTTAPPLDDESWQRPVPDRLPPDEDLLVHPARDRVPPEEPVRDEAPARYPDETLAEEAAGLDLLAGSANWGSPVPPADEPTRPEDIDRPPAPSPADEEPPHEPPADREPTDREPTDREPTDREPTDREPTEEAAAEAQAPAEAPGEEADRSPGAAPAGSTDEAPAAADADEPTTAAATPEGTAPGAAAPGSADAAETAAPEEHRAAGATAAGAGAAAAAGWAARRESDVPQVAPRSSFAESLAAQADDTHEQPRPAPPVPPGDAVMPMGTVLGGASAHPPLPPPQTPLPPPAPPPDEPPDEQDLLQDWARERPAAPGHQVGPVVDQQGPLPDLGATPPGGEPDDDWAARFGALAEQLGEPRPEPDQPDNRPGANQPPDDQPDDQRWAARPDVPPSTDFPTGPPPPEPEAWPRREPQRPPEPFGGPYGQQPAPPPPYRPAGPEPPRSRDRQQGGETPRSAARKPGTRSRQGRPEDPRQAAVYDALAINEQVLDEVWTSPSVDVLKVVSSIVVNALDAYEDDPAEYADWVAVHRTGNCDCH